MMTSITLERESSDTHSAGERNDGAASRPAPNEVSLFLALPIYALTKLLLLPRDQAIPLLDAFRQHGLPTSDEADATVDDAVDAFSAFQFPEALRLSRSAAERFTSAVESGDGTTATAEFRSFTQALTRIPWSPKLCLTALAGLVETTLTGAMPDSAQHARLLLHTLSDNAFNELAGAALAERRPSRDRPIGPNVLKLSDKADATLIGDALRRDGIHLSPHRLEPALCDRIEDFARDTPVTVARDSGGYGSAPRAVFDDPSVDGCYVDTQHVLDNPDVQRLLIDDGLWAVARDYLGCEPTCIGPNLWWSLPSDRPPSNTLAQQFHWDAGWLNWFNVFIYLTDCATLADGPHVMVEGTHRRGAKPETMRGSYRRIPDDEIAAHYGQENIRAVTAPRGSLFMEDTRVWHKGSRPTTKPRLVLQINFVDTVALSNLFFGRKLRLPTHSIPEFSRFLAEHPKAFSPLYYDGL